MKPQKFIKQVQSVLQTFAFWKGRSPVCTKDRAERIAGKTYGVTLGKQKHPELEKLCTKLFERKELIASGRLQLLGLEKIKLRMGKGWPGLQLIVYDICEKIMQKYFGPGDIFIRYQDSGYIILFSEASLAEAELKTTLIAEEIRRELFFEENLKDIEIRQQVTQIRSRIAGASSKVNPFPSSVEVAFEEGLKETPEERGEVTPPDFAGVRRIDVEAYKNGHKRVSSLDLGFSVRAIPNDAVKYMPVWDNQRKKLSAHLCLMAEDGHGNPLISHKEIFHKKSAPEKAAMDIAMLNFVVQTVERRMNELMDPGVICPVHFDTFSRIEDSEKFRMICQKANDYVRRNILFIVLDVPLKTSWINLSQIVTPFKTFCRGMFAELPLVSDTDFDILRLSGFDDVAFILESDMANRRSNTLRIAADIRNFTAKAKQNRLEMEIFVLGADDPVMALSLADAGVRYVAGEAIHPCVPAPVERINLEFNSNFRVWQKSLNISRSG